MKIKIDYRFEIKTATTVAIISFIFSVILIFLSYRNIDFSFNLLLFYYYGIYDKNTLNTLCDKSIYTQNCFNVFQLYEIGLSQLVFGFLLSLISFIILIYMILKYYKEYK